MNNPFIPIVNVSPRINKPPGLDIIRGRFLADVQKRRFLNLLKIGKPYTSMKSLFLITLPYRFLI